MKNVPPPFFGAREGGASHQWKLQTEISNSQDNSSRGFQCISLYQKQNALQDGCKVYGNVDPCEREPFLDTEWG